MVGTHEKPFENVFEVLKKNFSFVRNSYETFTHRVSEKLSVLIETYSGNEQYTMSLSNISHSRLLDAEILV